MGALPKRRTTPGRRDRRRSHLILALPSLVLCSQCGKHKVAHRACPSCGSYAGRQVIKPKGSKSKGEG